MHTRLRTIGRRLLISFSAVLALVRAENVVFQCDHLFDASTTNGTFSFPILPLAPSSPDEQRIPIPSIYDEPETTPRPMVVKRNMQCIYTFVAREDSRVKLDFEHFQLAGTSENCEAEYVDIYSELERADENLLTARLGGRYCGSVSPHIRISLYNVLVLVFHSRVKDAPVPSLGFKGYYSFIPEAQYIAGIPDPPGAKCSFIIDSSHNKIGDIYSPTYPGTYPKNFNCSYLLRGQPGQRIKLKFEDFDVYFGGEHCPYDSLTVFDGPNATSPIIKKVCGLQQRVELFSFGPTLLIHFNSTDPPKADPRGYVIRYEFSSGYVDIAQMLRATGEDTKRVSHMRGTECNVRVESNKETNHTIESPKYPFLYPSNITCTYVLDGLQGDQDLEKVIVTFEDFAVISDANSHRVEGSEDDESVVCPSAYVGIAISDGNMKATLSSTDESNFDDTMCGRYNASALAGISYTSSGPRMVLQFGTTDTRSSHLDREGGGSLGFKARVFFKTDFGIPGEPVADSNVCAFRFSGAAKGYFNSPRYPANYPLATNCTYDVVAKPGKMILIHFEQFALELAETNCEDYLQIFDIFHDDKGNEIESREQAKYCSNAVPGPRFSSIGSHHMRVFFSSSPSGTGNGFKLLYEMRPALKEEVPSEDAVARDVKHIGATIYASDDLTYGHISTLGTNYKADMICDWKVIARPGNQILLTIDKLDVEGSMKGGVTNCQKAVIRVTLENRTEIELCGQDPSFFKPVLSVNGTVRVGFVTSPDKVNGLAGFNFSWVETRIVEDDNKDTCNAETEWHCTYSKYCIPLALKCNDKRDCGHNDDTDELPSFCSQENKDSNWIITSAFIFSGCIFAFIIFVLCYLFKKKLEKKQRKARRQKRAAAAGASSTASRGRGRQPYRGAGHKPAAGGAAGGGQSSETILLAEDATSRFVHHDATGILPPVKLRTIGGGSGETFYG